MTLKAWLTGEFGIGLAMTVSIAAWFTCRAKIVTTGAAAGRLRTQA